MTLQKKRKKSRFLILKKNVKNVFSNYSRYTAFEVNKSVMKEAGIKPTIQFQYVPNVL